MMAAPVSAAAGTLSLGVLPLSNASVPEATISASGTADPAYESDELDIFTAASDATCASSAETEDLALGFPLFDTAAYPGLAYVTGPFSQSFDFAPGTTTGGVYLVCGYLSDETMFGVTDATAQTLADLAPSLPAGIPPPISPPPRPKPHIGDSLTAFGARSKEPPYFRLYAFKSTCAALPCHIKLADRAFVGRTHVRGLDSRGSIPQIVQRSNPQKDHVFAAWFQSADFNKSLLVATVKRYGAVTLQVSAELVDASGRHLTADRKITLRSTPPPVKLAPAPPPTQIQLVENAVDQAAARDFGGDSEDYGVVSCRSTGPSTWTCIVGSMINFTLGPLEASVTETNGHYYVGAFQSAP